MEVGFIFIAATFFAGLLTFLAPCTLPLVPAYLGFISGVNQKELKTQRRQRLLKRRFLETALLL